MERALVAEGPGVRDRERERGAGVGARDGARLVAAYELSGLAATRPEVLRALSRIFWEALRRRYQRWAKRAGHATRVETGAVTGVHRAGASLNVHVHFHVLCLDGVYVETEVNGGTLRFEAAPAPSRECLARLAAMVPPPRYPLLRLHGVLAPRHPWRARVVPRPPES